MSKELLYQLPYRQDGEKKIIEIKIDFLSRGISRDFHTLNEKSNMLKLKWDELNDTITLISAARTEKADKERIRELDARRDELMKEILSFDKEDFINQQHELLQIILKDNGIKNTLLLSFDFWERQVDTQDMMEFLLAVIYKDMDLKKKH
jgi:hypothetical protein